METKWSQGFIEEYFFFLADEPLLIRGTWRHRMAELALA
jgi:hypothetical protein